MLSQCLVGQIQVQKPTLIVVANWISMLFRLQSSIISIGSTITNDIKRIARKKERTNNGALRNISINRKLLCRLHIRETVARRCSVKKVFSTEKPVAEACNFIKKETLALVFSCECYEIFKNTFFTEHVRANASRKPDLKFHRV